LLAKTHHANFSTGENNSTQKDKSYPQGVALVDNFCLSGFVFPAMCLNSTCWRILKRGDKLWSNAGVVVSYSRLVNNRDKKLTGKQKHHWCWGLVPLVTIR